MSQLFAESRAYPIAGFLSSEPCAVIQPQQKLLVGMPLRTDSSCSKGSPFVMQAVILGRRAEPGGTILHSNA